MKVPIPSKDDILKHKNRTSIKKAYRVTYDTVDKWSEYHDIVFEKYPQKYDVPQDFIEQFNKQPINCITRLSDYYSVSPSVVKTWLSKRHLEHSKTNYSLVDVIDRDILINDFRTLSRKELMGKYNVSSHTLYNNARRLGLNGIIEKWLDKKIPTPPREEIEKYSTHKELCKVFGVSYTVTKRWTKEYGLDRFNQKYYIRKHIHSDYGPDYIIYKKHLLMDFIKTLDPSCKSKRWNYDGKTFEIDCYCEDKKIGFDFCGLYWHSERNKNRSYHKQKLEWCLKQGITLITIFENEYENSFDILKNMIRVRLGFGNRIYARNCKVTEISKHDAEVFCRNNHIHGYRNSSIRIGLFNNDVLVSVMTFSKTRFRGKSEYEIIRMCSLGDSVVVGGAGKMLRYFIKRYNLESIMTYSDRRFGEGKVYENIGFNFIRHTQPNYVYWKNGFDVYPRQKYTKKNMEKYFGEYNELKSEHEIMNENGFYRIYDCGNNLYTLDLISCSL